MCRTPKQRKDKKKNSLNAWRKVLQVEAPSVNADPLLRPVSLSPENQCSIEFFVTAKRTFREGKKMELFVDGFTYEICGTEKDFTKDCISNPGSVWSVRRWDPNKSLTIRYEERGYWMRVVVGLYPLLSTIYDPPPPSTHLPPSPRSYRIKTEYPCIRNNIWWWKPSRLHTNDRINKSISFTFLLQHISRIRYYI